MPVVGVANSNAIQYTVQDLVQMVYDMTYMSSNSRDWPPQAIVRLLNRCLFNYLVPFVVAANEEFYIVSQDIPLVSGQQNYALPPGCHNSNIRIVQLLDPYYNPSRILVQRELDTALNPYTLFGVTSGLGTPSSFYISNNSLWLVPIPTVGTGVAFLRIYYPLRPSQLVLPFDTLGNYSEGVEQTVGSISPGSGNVSVAFNNVALSPVMSSTSPFLTGNGGNLSVDCISADPPFDVLVAGGTGMFPQTAGAGPVVGTVVFPYTVPPTGPSAPPGLVTGRNVWMAVSSTAPVVTATPIETSFGLMTAWVTAKIMEAKGDDAGYERILRSLQTEEERAKEMLRRRVRGPGKRAFSNPYSGKGGRGLVAFYT
jgi:hypothetical protein